jgi:predicted nucleic acid-binding protein
MKPRFILDTSAIITYFAGETGSDIIKDLFERSINDKALILIPFIAQIEFYYINYKKTGEDTANQRYVYLSNLPVVFISGISELYVIQTGRIKVQYQISMAGAMIASYALIEDAILAHKDPEFLLLEKEIKLQTLPLKQ